MKALITALLLFACLGVSSAYYCWVCESEDYFDGATCTDPFMKGDSTLAKQQCSGDCFKETITYENGAQKFRRGCGPCIKGCSTTGTTRTCTSCCLGQLCNGAEGVRVNRVAAMVTSVAATLYYFL